MRLSNQEDNDAQTVTQHKVELPSLYEVIMHNDDYTTMDFVIHVLQKFFQKTADQAHEIMLRVHHDGQAQCGVYTKEVAEAKAFKVNKYSRSKGHPLKCSYQPCQS